MVAFAWNQILLALRPSRAALSSPSTAPATPTPFGSRYFREESYTVRGLSHKRDESTCEAAFGVGSINNICTPSKTLCCVKSGDTYPKCVQKLGKGWCCVGSDVGGRPDSNNGCYVDQASVCAEQGAVSCKTLAAGTSKACGPRYTSCADGYNFTTSFVRCQIQESALYSLASPSNSISSSSLASPSFSSSPSPSSSSSSSSPVAISTVRSVSTDGSTVSKITVIQTSAIAALSVSVVNQSVVTTNSKGSTVTVKTTAPAVVIEQTNTIGSVTSTGVESSASPSAGAATQGTGSALSTGAIAGIAVGPTVALAIGIALGWWIFKNKKAKQEQEMHPTQHSPNTSVPLVQFREEEPKQHYSDTSVAELEHPEHPTYELDSRQRHEL